MIMCKCAKLIETLTLLSLDFGFIRHVQCAVGWSLK